MKSILLLLIIFITPLTAISQEIPLGANIIELQTNHKRISSAVRKTAALLNEGGIGLARADKKKGVIITQEYPYRFVINELILTFHESEKGVVIKLFGVYYYEPKEFWEGHYVIHGGGTIEYIGPPDTKLMQAWEGLQKVANMIEHSGKKYISTNSRVNIPRDWPE